MKSVILSGSRGAAHFGWLKSRHTFSFGDYFNPLRSGFSVLKVINEDEVAPGKGFDTHCHRNMEIISYVLKGSIEHKDSLGNERISTVGDIQLISAGEGLFHSEINPSPTEELVFLQIWIEPYGYPTKPNCQQKHFNVYDKHAVLITPDGRSGSLKINQDVIVSTITLEAETELSLPVDDSRAYYIHVVFGQVDINETVLNGGDGLEIENANQLRFTKRSSLVHVMLFDLPGLAPLYKTSLKPSI